MSAVNPLSSPDSAADKRAYEPSMEEILASIRRIIADDQSLPGRGQREPEPAATPLKREPQRPAVSDEPGPSAVAAPTAILRPERPPVEQPAPVESRAPHNEPTLDASLAHGSIAAPQFAMPDGPVTDDRHSEPEPEIAAAPSAPQTRDAPARHVEPATAPEPDESPYDRPIKSAPVNDTPREMPRDNPSLFSAATDSAVAASFNMLAASRLADNSDELMTLARDMIRPLLRSWIDDNLPGMVERMVRAEIERVARGGR